MEFQEEEVLIKHAIEKIKRIQGFDLTDREKLLVIQWEASEAVSKLGVKEFYELSLKVKELDNQ